VVHGLSVALQPGSVVSREAGNFDTLRPAASTAQVYTTAELELAYIVDRHHNGKLAFSLEDLMDWCQQHEDDIRRNRSEDGIATWIETSE
jgi:hypothetical protein